MRPQEGVEQNEAYGERRLHKSKGDDTAMRPAMHGHEFTEIAIVGHQDPIVTVGDVQNDRILEIARIVVPDARHVVPEPEEVTGDAGVGTSVDQKSHAIAEVAANSSRRRSART